jgi:hypothetical protein
MHTIKFRGYNQKNKCFIYWYFFENRDEYFITPGGLVNPLATSDDYIVDIHTVGQFTWLLDINGKEIYEGI